MKAILLTFDSLNRHLLSPYGCDWTHTPNFSRLAERTLRFNRAFVGSMPCVPARRELQTGRYNFLHRSWGPLEPFDFSVPEALGRAGVYTHITTDHQHYWEDGGAGYLQRYRTYEMHRGQEGDAWRGQVNAPSLPAPGMGDRNPLVRQDLINRQGVRAPADFSQARTVAAGLDFIDRNRAADNWLLHIECFDPHEPFHAPEHCRARFPQADPNRHFDWPAYGTTEGLSAAEIEHVRREYAALLSFCDEQLGRVLDAMDGEDLWRDTLLIVHTDHGFFLGERGQMAKCVQPFYPEVAQIPLFVHDPRNPRPGESTDCLVQTVDLAPTLLGYFGVEIPEGMDGRDLAPVLAADKEVRTAGLFGLHGLHVNLVTPDYIYMRAPVASNRPLFNYTLVPQHMRTRFSLAELRGAELVPGGTRTGGCPVLKIEPDDIYWNHAPQLPLTSLLFDLLHDPGLERPLTDPTAEEACCDRLKAMMRACDAPPEQFERLGLVGEKAT